MDAINDRFKAQEAKFALDDTQRFRVAARRNRLIGEWAAHLLHKTQEESVEYANRLVAIGVHGKDAVTDALRGDLAGTPQQGLIEHTLYAMEQEAIRQIEDEQRVAQS